VGVLEGTDAGLDTNSQYTVAVINEYSSITSVVNDYVIVLVSC
jgi:hypothetical protein